jgi:hypothetical protein
VGSEIKKVLTLGTSPKWTAFKFSGSATRVGVSREKTENVEMIIDIRLICVDTFESRFGSHSLLG